MRITGDLIVFKGKCVIGGDSAISVGVKGRIDIGCDFCANTTFRCVSYHSIIFHNSVLFGWDCLVMDSDFHTLTKVNGGYSKGYAPIEIGKYNWFGNGCKIMKRTITPDYCTFQAGSIINTRIDVPPYCVIGTDSKLIIKASGVYRNPQDDKIKY